MAVTSIPIRTNAELRPSRLFSSMFGYVKKSMLTIGRALMMYKPLYCFSCIAGVFGITGIALGIRFLIYYFNGNGAGHVQSLLLCTMLIIIAVVTESIGLLGDVISANRKLLEDIQFELRKMDYGKGHEELRKNKDNDKKEKMPDEK